MSKDKLTDYSATAGSNTDIGGINIDEGMLPSGVNNALREQMSHLADFAAGTSGVDVLKLQDDTDTNSIKIQAPASVTTSTTFTLPDGDGSANQSLVTNGSGTLSFSTRLANVVEDTTPQLGGDLDTNGNDINFGDNDKAIFGAGSDLQIYHDGSHARLRETTGDFRIQTTSGGVNALVAKQNAEVEITYAGSTKLATTATGVDVTGTVTADELTVDGDVTINSTSPILTLSESDTTDLNTRFSIFGGGFRLDTVSDDGLTATKRITIGNVSGDISFYDNTGVTQGFFWDASTQRLGLGTTSPAQLLHLSTSNPRIRITDTDTAGSFELRNTSNVAYISNLANAAMVFATNSTEAMRIDSSGNLGIGTNSPSVELEVYRGTGNVDIKANRGDADYIQLSAGSTRNFITSNTYPIAIDVNGSERMRIDSSGNVGIGTTSPSARLHIETAGSGDALVVESTDSGDTFAPDIAIYRNTSTPADNDGIGLVSFRGRNDASQDVEYVQIVTGAGDVTDGSENGNFGIKTMVDGSLDNRFVINNDGNVLVGTDTFGNVNSNSFGFSPSSKYAAFSHANGTASGTGYISFGYNTSEIGSITQSGTTGVAYNTSSDYRLKENVTADWDATTRLKQLNPVRFNFIADPDTTVDGFLAHEVQDVVPEAITGTHNEVDDEGNPVYQGIDQSKLVPLLVKTIQELEARIAALEAN